jgi:hypothetical protein
LHRFVLADEALVENLVEAHKFLVLAFGKAEDGHAGPARNRIWRPDPSVRISN